MKAWLAAAVVWFLCSGSPAANAAEFRSVNLNLGAVVGYNVRNDNTPWSPVLGGGFEYGGETARLYADIHTMPLFRYQINEDANFSSAFVMATIGLTLGTNRFRIGPFVSGGFLGGTAGGRVAFTPKGVPRTGLHGVEWRLGYYFRDIVYAMGMYTWRFTKLRRDRRDRRRD